MRMLSDFCIHDRFLHGGMHCQDPGRHSVRHGALGPRRPVVAGRLRLSLKKSTAAKSIGSLTRRHGRVLLRSTLARTLVFSATSQALRSGSVIFFKIIGLDPGPGCKIILDLDTIFATNVLQHIASHSAIFRHSRHLVAFEHDVSQTLLEENQPGVGGKRSEFAQAFLRRQACAV